MKPQHSIPNPIFIIGCARSGTTWLGRIIDGCPNVRATIENPLTFGLVDRMALDPRTVGDLFPELRRLYTQRMAKALPGSYLDKSHQNLWLVERLHEAFPGCVFLAIEREPYAVVASMARHPGARAHFERWRRYPLPVRHIGVTDTNAPQFDSLSLVEKCAWRWLSHHHRLEVLLSRFPDRIVKICYEQLVKEPATQCAMLATRLATPTLRAVPRRHCLEKWQETLSSSECASIETITGCTPPLRARMAEKQGRGVTS